MQELYKIITEIYPGESQRSLAARFGFGRNAMSVLKRGGREDMLLSSFLAIALDPGVKEKYTLEELVERCASHLSPKQ